MLGQDDDVIARVIPFGNLLVELHLLEAEVLDLGGENIYQSTIQSTAQI